MVLVLITLICLCAQVGRALRVQQPYRVVASDGEVRLRCSYNVRSAPEEMRLALYQGKYGEQQICASTFNVSQSHFQTNGPIQCRGELSPGAVDLIISGLTGNDTDLYRCRIEVLYPPPYLMKIGNGTIVYIPEKTDCPAPAAQSATREDSPSSFVILPVTVLSFFIIIIIILVITTYKLFSVSHRKRMHAHLPPVIPKRVDCRFGYENFL